MAIRIKERTVLIDTKNTLVIYEGAQGRDPLDYLTVMNSAVSLENAIELGFFYLPLGSRFLGPQKKILLFRNGNPVGHRYAAEITVIDVEEEDTRAIFNATWRKNQQFIYLLARFGDKIEDRSNQW
jgi:hypothetical protein